MKTKLSAITFDEAVRYIMHFCPLKIYYNRKCIWDDTLGFYDGWLSLKDALDNFCNTYEDYERIVITDLKVEIVDWYHSVVYLKGKRKERNK